MKERTISTRLSIGYYNAIHAEAAKQNVRPSVYVRVLVESAMNRLGIAIADESETPEAQLRNAIHRHDGLL